MNYNLNGNNMGDNHLDGGQMAGNAVDPGVVEVMASPETEGPFTEDMINQVIAMLQSEGQITPETHTVIVHTTNGPTLRVQIQQVDSAELEQDNIEELGPEGATANDPQQQDQLVYVGQAEEEYTQQEVQQQYQTQHESHQQYTTQGTIGNEQHILQNGGQLMAVSEQHQGSVSNTADGTVLGQMQYSSADSEEVGIPAALMSNVAEQVLQAANIMDSGYTSAQLNSNTNTVSTDRGTMGTFQQQQHSGNLQMNGSVHTESLHNGVVLSYGDPSQLPAQQLPTSQGYSTTNGINDSNDRLNGHTGMFVNQKTRSDFGAGLKMSSGTQYVDPTVAGSSGYSDNSKLYNRAGSSPNKPQLSRRKPITASHTICDDIVRIVIDTGRTADVVDIPPDGVIRISTTTGQLKTRTPKFNRCPTCTMHFASENALQQHIKHSCTGSRKRTSYECTYCSAKFASKTRTVDHLKVCTMRTQIKSGSKTRNVMQQGSTTGRVVSRKPTTQTVEVEINSDDEEETAYRQEKSIVYDDDDDVDVDLAADNEDYETHLSKVSQKHLGPMLTEGKYKCRDCDRTFNKDAQYKRHIGACTNAPLNASRIDDSDSVPLSERKSALPEKKRGRPRKIVADKLFTPPPVKAKPLPPVDKVKSYTKAPSHTSADNKDNFSDLEWDDLLSSPKKDKSTETLSSGKKSSHIMDMLKENLGDSTLVDGAKELSESFLQCLDGDEENSVIKQTPPGKPADSGSSGGVCGLCVRRMRPDENLAEHISTSHAKDVVNMHAILVNNTDLTTHRCAMCPLHFVSSEGVLEHMAAQHMDGLQDSLRTLRANSLDLPCPWCPQRSMTKELFQQHLAAKHTHRFPETALAPPAKALKPEELAAKSLQAALQRQENTDDALLGRVCLHCGQTFTKLSKLEQHTATCDQEETSAQHPCYFPDCDSKTFNSLADLVAHIEEEHAADEGCERRLFPNSSLFGAWLKQEQQRSGYKFIRATSRIRTGCCHVTYLCNNYNTAPSAGPGAKPKKAVRSKPCYARLHVRTRWCHSKFDYCGRTEVTYFKEHQHATADEENSFAAIVEASKSLKVRFKTSDRIGCDEGGESRTASPDPPVTSGKKKIGPKSKMLGKQPSAVGGSTAAAVVSRVEGEGEASQVDDDSKCKEEDNKNVEEVSDVPRMSSGAVQTPKGNSNGAISKKVLEKPTRTPIPKQPFTPNGAAKQLASKAVKPKATLNNNSKKRLREEEDEGSDDESDNEQFYPEAKRKVSPMNNLKNRAPPSVSKSVNNNVRKPVNKRKPNLGAAGGGMGGQQQPPPAKKAKILPSSVQEETTYVLPANISEWCKLFDMVQSQITYGSLKKSDVPEARTLLKHQDDITELALEEQVRVFHRLCNLANIQVD